MNLSKNVLNHCFRKHCGAGRDRTDDIQLAKLALSQLSYSPPNVSLSLHLPAVVASPSLPARGKTGGPRWTRTTDLALIRRAL